MTKRTKAWLYVLVGVTTTATILHTLLIQPKEIEVPTPVYIDREVPIYIESAPKQQVLYVPVVNTDTKAYKLSAEDRALIEQCVAAEVGWCTFEDMWAIAQVIRNKLEHPNQAAYGGPTVEGVLYKPDQHYMNMHGSLEDYPLVKKAVSLVFDYGLYLFDDTCCIYFNPQTSDPAQIELLRKYEYVGSTEYCELRSDKLIGE